MQVRLLGPFSLHLDGAAIDTARWQRRPAMLIRLLASSTESQRSRDDVIDVFWPEADPAAGGSNLRYVLHLLRRALAPLPEPVVHGGGWLSLNPAYDWSIDLPRFEALARARGNRLEALRRAAELYGGEALVDDRYEDWAIPIRENIQRLWRELCRGAADEARQSGDIAMEAHAYELLLQDDPLDEQAMQGLLRTLKRLGRATEALERYSAFERQYSRELDEPPRAELAEQFAELRREMTTGTGDCVSEPLPSSIPTNLPDDPTTFIGRDHQLRDVVSLVRQPGTRLVTLTGVGGTGKTRLALRAAAMLLPAFQEGVFFCDLAPLSDPAHVLSTMADVLGIKEQAGRDPLEALVERLSGKHILVILDNFEHLLAASALVTRLLDACRELHVLATSRVRLRLSREIEYAVPPMSIPDLAERLDLDALGRQESIALFVDRARAVSHRFTLDEGNSTAVAQICSHLEGLPLSIELAAARVKLFPPQALKARLSNRLSLLTEGALDRHVRQQSVRGAIDWSYSLLTEADQTLLGRLAVFAGGATLEAAEAVCNRQGRLDLVEGLTSLLDKNLIRQESQEYPRFSMLETIREYAAERLAESGEDQPIRRAHLEYFLALAERTEPDLQGPSRPHRLRLLDSEHDNFRAAVLWASGTNPPAEEAGLLAGALFWFWHFRGHFTEGRALAQRAVAVVAAKGAGRAGALWCAGSIAWIQGDLSAARTELEESVAIWRVLGDGRSLAWSLNHLGLAVLYQGDPEGARRLMEEGLEYSRRHGTGWDLALQTANLGLTYHRLNRASAAREHVEEGLALFRDIGDPWGLSIALLYLGVVASGQSEYGRARSAVEEALPLLRAEGNPWNIAEALNLLAEIVMEQGDLVRAMRLLAEAFALHRDVGDKAGMAAVAHNLGRIALLHTLAEESAWYFALASVFRESVSGGTPLTLVTPEDQNVHIAAVRATLGEDAFAVAWAKGRRWDVDEAIILTRKRI
jgi:predicted ATPase/DNA-binding SARP family transcriptional activator